MKKLLLCVVLTALTACAGVGQKFDVEKVNQLTPGVSTSTEAVALLGKPMAESQNADGTKLLKWMYSRGTPVGGYGAHVQVLFDATGKMIRVAHKATVGL